VRLAAVGRAVLFGALLLSSARARAERGAPRSARVVEIHVDGDPQAVAQTKAVATEILPRISVIPVVLAEGADAPSYAAPNEPLLRAYFDFRSPAVRLVIVDSATRREIERRVMPEGATLETSVESVTHVLYMVVESFLEENAASEALHAEKTAPPPAPRPGAAPPSAPEWPLGVEAGLLFRTLYLGGERVQPGVGAALDVRVDGVNPRVSVVFQASAHTPFELSWGRANMRLSTYTASLVPSLQTRLAGDVLGLLGVGASMSWFSLSADVPAYATAASSTGGAEPAITAIVGCRFPVARRMTLTVTGTLDFDLVRRLFVVDVDGERQSLLDLPRVRPSLSLTGAYSLFGPVSTARAGAE
jgi:hypothetical protein